MKIFRKQNIKYTVVFTLAAISFVIMLFPTAGETFGFIAEFLNRVVGGLFSFIPFSFLTVAILTVPVFIGLIIFRIVVNAKRKTLKKFWINFFCVVCIFFVWFSFVLGLNYRKESVYDKMNFSNVEITTENIVSASDYVINQLNKNAENVEFDGKDRSLVLPDGYDRQKITEIVNSAIKKQNLNFLYEFDAVPKYTFVPGILNAFGFDGVYFPLFAELNVDSAVANGNLCVLLTHESIHGKGILNEGQTEFLAQFISINSDDAILRYCGSYSAVTDFLKRLKQTDADIYRMQLEKIEDRYLRLRLDYFVTKSILSEPDFFTGISNFFYDIYLRLNYVEGISSYGNDIVGWVRFCAS